MMQSYVQKESNPELLEKIIDLSNGLYELVSICNDQKEQANKLYEEISQKGNCFSTENCSGYVYLYNLSIRYTPIAEKSMDTYGLYSRVFNLLKKNLNIPNEYSKNINKLLIECINKVNSFKEKIYKTPWIIDADGLGDLNSYINNCLIDIRKQLATIKYS